MADGIRGRDYELFPEDVRRGILLHRAIDSFTDAHPLFRQGTKRLHEKYHHYAGVIVDVFYDHFLAANWTTYSEVSLQDYSALFYKCLEDHNDLLTERTRHMLPIMKRENWLLSYRSIDGIEKILRQMDHRTKTRSKMGESTAELIKYYELYREEFFAFFAELQVMCREHLELKTL